MLAQIAKTLEEECRLTKNERVLVGVSGGPDSVCLLDVLIHLNYPVFIAHLNHGLRPEAQSEADQVAELARRYQVPFLYTEVDAGRLAREKNLSIEEAARELRYSFLFQQAQEQHACAVAVGHNADDQVETVLMHLLRGAGLSGLTGMAYRSLPNPWSDHIALIRPLLGIWREQIQAYNQENDLKAVLDRSNLDTRFYRNRLRHELIPYLEGYNPGIRPILWRTADVLRHDAAALQRLVDSAWQASFKEEGAGYVLFKREALLQQHTGVQRRVMRRAISLLRPGLRDIDFHAVERAVNFLNSPNRSAQIDLISGLRMISEGEKLWLANWQADLPHNDWPQMPTDHLSLSVPGVAALRGDWRLQADWLDLTGNTSEALAKIFKNPDPFQAWLNPKSLNLPLTVRTRQPGDRLNPLGLQGHSIKLAEFMINAKLPVRARQKWPIVVSGEEIAWVPGMQIGHPFRLDTEARRAVHLHLYKTDF
ncbi:MAG: tRNA lysidine(34) synthetase TilS [Anaerolineales bacterium]